MHVQDALLYSHKTADSRTPYTLAGSKPTGVGMKVTDVVRRELAWSLLHYWMFQQTQEPTGVSSPPPDPRNLDVRVKYEVGNVYPRQGSNPHLFLSF